MSRPIFRTWSVALLLLALVPTVGFAITIPHESAQIEVWLPDHWQYNTEGNDLTAQTKSGEVSMVFSLIEVNDLKLALEQAVADIQKEVGQISLDEPQEKVHNGMEMLDFDGSAMNGKMVLSISLFRTPADKVLAVYAFAVAATINKHVPDLQKIVNGLKPIEGVTKIVKETPQAEPVSTPDNPDDEPDPVCDGPEQPVEGGGPIAPWNKGDTFFWTASNVNMRAEPNTKSKIVMTIDTDKYGSGEILGVSHQEVIGNYGSNWWVKAKVGGKIGWIYGAFIRGEGCSH